MNSSFKSRGLTLIELLLVIIVLLAVIALAVPSFIDTIQSRRLQNASESLYNDLLLARSEALKQQTTIYVAFQGGSNWCYGLNNNNTCNCSIANNCQLNGTTKIINGSSFSGISFDTSGFSSGNVAFEGVRGIASNTGTLTLSINSKTVKISINKMGYVQICSSNFPGYNPC